MGYEEAIEVRQRKLLALKVMLIEAINGKQFEYAYELLTRCKNIAAAIEQLEDGGTLDCD